MTRRVDEAYLAERLRELLGWADYVVESLVADRTYEQGKRELLERRLGDRALKDLRETAWTLRDRLDRAAVQLEISSPVEKA